MAVGSDPEYQANFKCAPLQCPAPTAPTNGKFNCKAPTADGKTTDFGTKCTLQCNQGFAVSGPSAVYTCDATEQFTGTGTCAEQTCSAPKLGSGMSSTGCEGSVKEGATCKPTCK